MKFCSRCSRWLDVTDFTINRSRKDGLQRVCRECQRLYVKAHYAANTPYYLAKAKRANERNRSLVRALLSELKSVPCVDCGQKYSPWVMEFDHVRGVKLFNVSDARARGVKAVFTESAKCEIVCANCHRERTRNRLHPRP
jgi:hypothetical protein